MFLPVKPISLAEYRNLICDGKYIPIRSSPKKTDGQEIATWLNVNGVQFQLFITRTPSVYQTTLQRQRELTASAIQRIQNSIGSQHRLGWLAGFETFPESNNQCHSHILVTCDTAELDSYFTRKLLCWDSHTDVKEIKPGTQELRNKCSNAFFELSG